MTRRSNPSFDVLPERIVGVIFALPGGYFSFPMAVGFPAGFGFVTEPSLSSSSTGVQTGGEKVLPAGGPARGGGPSVSSGHSPIPEGARELRRLHSAAQAWRTAGRAQRVREAVPGAGRPGAGCTVSDIPPSKLAT